MGENVLEKLRPYKELFDTIGAVGGVIYLGKIVIGGVTEKVEGYMEKRDERMARVMVKAIKEYMKESERR